MLNRMSIHHGRDTGPCTIEEAQARLFELISAPRAEAVPIAEALGRTTAAPILAAADQPRFDAAAMDGWAVAGDQAGLSRIVGESRAGCGFGRSLHIGEAVLISTGAPVPIGATRVVRREDATRRGTLVEVPALSGTKRDIRARGSDYRAGTPLVGTGRRLDPIDIARLCGAGVGVVQVAPQPRVAIVPTGDEIAHDGEAIGSDQIYDALSLPLSMRAETAGAVTRMRPPVRDGDDLIEAAIAGLDTDIIVFIGGASRGPHDRVRPALESLGLDLVVPALLVRPGKPSWCGQLADGRIVIGLAGNPVAALACAELLLLPLLRTWQGRSPHGRSFALPSEAASGGPLSRLQFGRLDISADGRAVAVPTGGSDSAALHPITGAELLIIRDPDGSGRAILLDP